jgi:hypothetical protein
MEKCIAYKGGKCIYCGYNKCPRSLVFHHRDPTTKSFGISGNYGLGWPLLQAELDKCDLICANCHGEIHYFEDRDKVYSIKKKRNITKYYDKVCFNSECQISFVTEVQSQSYCSTACRMYGTRKVKDRPSKEELLKMKEESSTAAISRKYKVSHSTIRKWLKQ